MTNEDAPGSGIIAKSLQPREWSGPMPPCEWNEQPDGVRFVKGDRLKVIEDDDAPTFPPGWTAEEWGEHLDRLGDRAARCWPLFGEDRRE